MVDLDDLINVDTVNDETISPHYLSCVYGSGVVTTSLAPYVPSQHDVVRKMLEVAHVNSNDVVFDLGCGDGRILFSAVQEYGANRAVGYELKTNLYKTVLHKIRKANLNDRVQVFNADLLTADISDATIITLYLTTFGNTKLKSKLATEAKIGTKVVSHDFEIKGWSPTLTEKFQSHTLYMYTLPDSFRNIRAKNRETRRKSSFWRRIV